MTATVSWTAPNSSNSPSRVRVRAWADSPAVPGSLAWNEVDVGAAVANLVVPVVLVPRAVLVVLKVAVALVNRPPSVLDVPTLNSHLTDL